MKPQKLVLMFFLVGSLSAAAEDSAQGKKLPAATGWCVTKVDTLEVTSKPAARKKILVALGRGALLGTYEVKQADRRSWTRVRAIDPAKLAPVLGWVDSSQVESFPLGRFPADGELLKLLGGPYLEDFTAAHTSVARYLVRRAGDDPLLVCFLGSPISATSRLQVFARTGDGLSVGPYLEVPFADMQSGIRYIQARDLMGDGNECLITHEAFFAGPRNQGVNLVVRSISAKGFATLWKAPIEIQNLGSFPPKIQVLAPPERNVGAPGTITKGDVEFRPRGRVREPVWKGKVEFYVVGRDESVQSVTVEKVCRWDGSRFAPLQ
ncbi:MAG: hypothetical protein LAN62_10320 [Acidobacteriia bacterium]|nr:hypothetical protein [Terriglobia bacterium]